MTLAGLTLDDIGGALPWRALSHFVAHLPRSSALSRELRPTDEADLWLDGTMVAPLLADLIDGVKALTYVTALAGRLKVRNKGEMLSPTPRPWGGGGHGRQRVGSDPVPASRFDSWWDSKGA